MEGYTVCNPIRTGDARPAADAASLGGVEATEVPTYDDLGPRRRIW